MLQRHAVQNRSKLLEINSDDDEWWGSKKGPSEVRIEDEDFVVVGPLVDSSSEEDDENDCVEGDMVMGVKDGSFTYQHSGAPNKKQIDESESEQEKPKQGGLRSESYLHWDPPYSTMSSMKGVDLLPTCSMIEEIFGSSNTGKSTSQLTVCREIIENVLEILLAGEGFCKYGSEMSKSRVICNFHYLL